MRRIRKGYEEVRRKEEEEEGKGSREGRNVVKKWGLLAEKRK